MLNKISLNADFYIKNREILFEKLKPNSIAILISNPILIKNADSQLPFYQNSDLLYLTGIDQINTSLILYKDTNNINSEILFIKKYSNQELIWETQKIDEEKAIKISGIQNIEQSDKFETYLKKFAPKATEIYLNYNEINKLIQNFIPFDLQFIQKCQQNYPLHKYIRLNPIINDLRTIKQEQEINIIKEACEITNQAYLGALKTIKPGKMEYEIEAEFIYSFRKKGAKGHAYNPIVAAGENSCVLHYENNDSELKDGEMVLIDIGVNFQNYNSDITRTIPINGKFSARQKEVYNAVLYILNQAKNILKPGLTFNKYNELINDIVGEQLMKINLIKKEQLKDKTIIRKYFMHNISHHLGLDVHDTCNYDMPFAEGMVITIEPGIYIKNEKIGIRLENNIVIRKNGVEDLSSMIPIEIEEIENIMAKK